MIIAKALFVASIAVPTFAVLAALGAFVMLYLRHRQAIVAKPAQFALPALARRDINQAA